MSNGILKVSCFALSVLWFTAPVTAQIVTGSMIGTVEDASGLAVPGAKVTLTNPTRGFERSAETSETGTFAFNGIDSGEYSVSASKDGFKTAQQRGIMLATGERLPLRPLMLQVGSVAETISVIAQAATVQTESAERSDVVTTKQVDNLLIMGRNVADLVKLLPGVVDTGSAEALSRNINYNVMGNRDRTNNVAIDGVATVENDSGTSQKITISQDAVAEVKILISNYQAEYGRTAGSNVQIVTKSGTTSFHGLASYFKRHEQFNANDFFDNRDGQPRPRYRYNTYNYNLGGPVFIPGKFNRNRDKLFFFWSQEFWPSRIGVNGKVTMPTALERAGDFSQSLDLNNKPIVLRDPFNGGAPFAGNRIPQSRIDPSGQALLKVFPLPNFFDRATSAGQYNYLFTHNRELPQHTESLKLDYNVSTQDRLVFNFSSYRQRQTGTGVPGSNANWPQMSLNYSQPGHIMGARYTKILSPAVINEFRVGWLHSREAHQYSDSELARNQRAAVGFVAGQFHPEINPLGVIPNARFGGVPGAATLTIEGRFPFKFRYESFDLDEKMTITRGAHTIKFGFSAEKFYRNMPVQGSAFNGSVDFGRNANNFLDTGYAWSNAMLGVFNTYTEASGRSIMHARSVAAEAFIQDNWKVTRRLTLDYGVRFSHLPPMGDRDNLMAGFVPDRYDPSQRVKLIQPGLDASGRRVGVNPLTGDRYPAAAIGAFVGGSGNPFNGMVVPAYDSSYPGALAESSSILVAPRVGFAYDVFGNGKTAIRSGFGEFFNREAMAHAYKWLIAQPPLVLNPVVYYGQLPALLSSSGLNFPTDVLGRTRDSKTPSVMNFSFSIQQNLGYGIIADVGYVGSLGRHLIWRRNINSVPAGANFAAANADPTLAKGPLPPAFLRPVPGYNDINMIEPAGTSNYHSMQVTARRRFARGLQFGMAWTWSKAMDFNDDDANSADNNVSSIISPRVWNYGLAGWDRTHVLNINYLYEVPKVRWNHAASRWFLHGWQLSGITSFASGAPRGIGFTQVTATDITGTPSQGARVVVTGNPVLPKSERSFSQVFRTDVFRMPAVGTFGNAAKTEIRGPGANNWDIAIFKNFPVREPLRIQFRAEMYNAFNHTQFDAVDTTARFDALGNQVNARFGQYSSARRPRQIQFALRFAF